MPIVNENDTVATHEIRFGDNDRLAALVAHLVRRGARPVDRCGLVYDGPPSERRGAQRIPAIRSLSDLDQVRIGGSGSMVGTGGMATKIEVAAIANPPAFWPCSAAPAVGPALAGEDVGTIFPAGPGRQGQPQAVDRARHRGPRDFVVDAGAVAALVERRKSLLPAGITGLVGLHRGRSGRHRRPRRHDHRARSGQLRPGEIPKLLGARPRNWPAEFGPEYEREVVHRDNLVVR